MADRLAVGLSKSVVVGAITKIQSAIDEDARLRQKVKRDLVSITLELEMMQSFLDDANEEMKNNLVRTWVKHIRQLAYDVEDCVENVVQLDDKPIFWRRLLPSWMAPPLPLDQAVEELEHLKCRVEDVNNCYRRYSLINIESAAGSSSNLVHGKTAYEMLLADVSRTTKRQHSHLDDLTSHIITNKVHKHLQVISLWGSAGDQGDLQRSRNLSILCLPRVGEAGSSLQSPRLHPWSYDSVLRELLQRTRKGCNRRYACPIHDGYHPCSSVQGV